MGGDGMGWDGMGPHTIINPVAADDDREAARQRRRQSGRLIFDLRRKREKNKLQTVRRSHLFAALRAVHNVQKLRAQAKKQKKTKRRQSSARKARKTNANKVNFRCDTPSKIKKKTNHKRARIITHKLVSTI